MKRQTNTNRKDITVTAWESGLGTEEKKQQDFAIVIKYKTDTEGSVKICLATEYKTVRTRPGSIEGVKMVILRQGFFCYWSGGATVRVVK